MRERTMIVVFAAVLAIAARANAQEQLPPRQVGPQQDARSVAPPKIGFDEAVKRATTRNVMARVADQEVRRAEALVEQVRAEWLPTLRANGVYTRLDQDRVLNGRTIQGIDSVSANLVLNVPLLAPSAWAESGRAKSDREYAKLSAADVRRQLALSTGRAYLTIIAQRRILETSIQARDTARAHEEFSKARLEGGVGNRLDAVRAGQERATAETRVFNQTIALYRAQEALGVLAAENGPLDAADVNLSEAPTLTAALGEMERVRTDVVAARQRVDATRRSSRDSYADYLPMLDAVAQPFYQNPATLTLPTTGWQAQLVLRIPLYDGGLRYGLEHEREALFAESKAKLEGQLRQARSEVRVAFEAVQRTDEALVRAREASALAEESLQLSQLAYRAGATSNIEVVDAERRARDAETEAAIAEDSARQARLDLLAASGRFPDLR